MRTVTSKLSYANVTATVALFIALGGTSYAALTLPRNSVGSRQIATGAVHSSEVKDRSLALRDLSLAARTSLRGTPGVAGPAGPQGVPGAAATRYFAAVNAAGALVRGNATSAVSAGGVGNYTVGFSGSTSSCAYSATLGSTDGTPVVAGRVTVRDIDGRVGVQTFDAAGAAADLPFFLIVSC